MLERVHQADIHLDSSTTIPHRDGVDLARAERAAAELLTFQGVAHVGYLSGAQILGLSQLARVVEMLARDLQVQERLTKQVADWLQDNLAPRGVGVVIEAEHLCMSPRGVQAAGSSTLTSALHGLIRDDRKTRDEFLAMTGVRA